MLRVFVDGFFNAVKLRSYGSSVIKAILRELRFPDTELTVKGSLRSKSSIISSGTLFVYELTIVFILQACSYFVYLAGPSLFR